MKKTIVVAAALVAVGALVVVGTQTVASVKHAPRTSEAKAVAAQPTSERLIEKARKAAAVVGGLKIMTGEGDSAQLAASLKEIGEAEQVLKQLDEQLRAAIFVSGLNIMIGVSNSAESAQDVKKIEDARQEVLASIGLVQR